MLECTSRSPLNCFSYVTHLKKVDYPSVEHCETLRRWCTSVIGGKDVQIRYWLLFWDSTPVGVIILCRSRCFLYRNYVSRCCVGIGIGADYETSLLLMEYGVVIKVFNDDDSVRSLAQLYNHDLRQTYNGFILRPHVVTLSISYQSFQFSLYTKTLRRLYMLVVNIICTPATNATSN